EGDAALMEDIALPLLEELGVDVVDSAINDAPPDDVTAANAQTAVIAERFESAGADQVLLVGQAGLVWGSGAENLDYRPELRITNMNSMLAFTSDAGARDLTLLDGAIAGGSYGGKQNLFELPGMQDCIEVLEAA